MRRLKQGRDSLLEYFGKDQAVHGITEANAENDQRWLRHEAPHRRREGVTGFAEPGEVLVLPWLTDRSSAALRKPLQRAIDRAGVKPWPRLWHNLRSTRQTELERHFPSHVVCAWLGNSRAVAAKHYLQVTDDDFAAAICGIEKSAALSAAIMHGHSESPETETALTGSGRGIDGQVVLNNDPYGI
ncbi:MAG: hypothetical protein AAGG38_04590 [Planctomycetota bacterium]